MKSTEATAKKIVTPLATAVGELLEQLARLQAALKALSELAAAKLAALRKADAAALADCAAREEALLKSLFGTERARDAAIASVAQSLRLAAAPRPRLRDLASRLPEPLASNLRARAAGLEEVARELQQKNGLAADVARRLHSHIRGVFADVATAAQESVVYGAQGQFEGGRPRCWVDAVG